MKHTVIAGALGNCVHVAGAVKFLAAAGELGYKTVFLGAAVPVERIIEAIEREDPEIVGISYRLTPEAGERLALQLSDALSERDLLDRRFVFGGTPPVCAAVEKLGLFERCFTGLEDPDEVWQYIRGEEAGKAGKPVQPADDLLGRLEQKRPFPLLRHHFGLPRLSETIDGVRAIAESQCLDVISIAPDQNAQECMFRPDEMDPAVDGAGGVPVRSSEDLGAIYQASRRGNHPLMRIYSGTRDLVQWAELAQRTVHNAWAAIPLCWYNQLDGRSRRPPEESIAENQAAMRWCAERGIPVEVNEPHHWALRDAHDTIAVVAAYLAAYNARAMGVRRYVAQYMFNTPPGLEGAMDLAKAAAQIEMVEGLHGPEFTSVRQVRAGLLHLSPRLLQAKGQLAASTMLALAVRPHVIHVVGFCEGDHAAGPDDVIESCEIVKGVLRNAWWGMPDMLGSPEVQERKNHLLSEARQTLEALAELAEADEDPLTSPTVISKAIRTGVLDAPHLSGNEAAAGLLATRLIGGAVEAVDPGSGKPLPERARLNGLAHKRPKGRVAC